MEEDETSTSTGGALMSFSMQAVGGTRTAFLHGELDMSCKREVDHIVEALSSSDCPQVVFDVTNLSFVDSTGLSYLVKATWVLREEGKDVQLEGARGSVLKVIELTGLADELNMVPPSRGSSGGRHRGPRR
jgi:anti-anti-sigma factor